MAPTAPTDVLDPIRVAHPRADVEPAADPVVGPGSGFAPPMTVVAAPVSPPSILVPAAPPRSATPEGEPVDRAVALSPGDRLVLLGIFAIFAVNALAAVFDPAGFRALVDDSALTRLVGLSGSSAAVWVIAVNDALVAVGAAVALRRPLLRGIVFMWAGAWLVVAAAVKITSF